MLKDYQISAMYRILSSVVRHLKRVAPQVDKAHKLENVIDDIEDVLDTLEHEIDNE